MSTKRHAKIDFMSPINALLAHNISISLKRNKILMHVAESH